MPAQSYWGATKPPAGVQIDPSHPLAQGLVGYWPLGAWEGMDARGANHLSKIGSIVQSPGRSGSSSSFVASRSEYFNHPDSMALRQGGGEQLTVCAWVNLATLANETFVGKWEGSTPSREYLLFYNVNDHAPNNRFCFAVSSNGTTITNVDVTGFGAATVGPWHFVLGWYDGATINIRVNNTAPTSSAYSSGIYQGIAPLSIGRLNLPGAYFMNGQLEGVGVWRRVLSAQEQTQLFAQPYAMFAAPTWRRLFAPAAAVVAGTGSRPPRDDRNWSTRWRQTGRQSWGTGKLDEVA